MRHNPVIPVQPHHCVGQQIPADRLSDIFHELRAVAFHAGPVLPGIQAHVGHAFAAELIFLNPGQDVGQFPPGGQAVAGTPDQGALPAGGIQVFAAEDFRMMTPQPPFTAASVCS